MFAKRSNSRIFSVLLVGVSMLALVNPVYATTLTVTNTNDSGAGSLRDTIASAAPGDTISFDSGLSGATIRLVSTLTLSKNVIIDGSALASQITISGDTTGDGPGDVRVFYVNSGVTVTLESLTITKGYLLPYEEGNNGGGIYNNGTLTVTGSNFSDNIGGYNGGGGIYNAGTLTVTTSTFTGNLGTNGGGIYSTAMATVLNNTFSGNGNSSTWGGAIQNSGAMIVANSTFFANTGSGGAIQNYGLLTVVNSTFSENTGRVLFVPSPPAYFYLSDGIWNQDTLNFDNNPGQVQCSPSPPASCYYFAGGIHNQGTLNFANNIIANSTDGGDCVSTGTIGINGHNLIEDGSCSAFLSGDPMLGALAPNGGPTQTYALSADSPAIDAGADSICDDNPGPNNLDQRGATRPQGAHCDIGSYELDTTAPTVISSVRANPEPTSAASVDFTVTFSESVTGVDIGDFELTTTGVTGESITGVTGSGDTYTVSVDTASGNGTIRLDVLDDDSILDASSNPLNGGFTGGEVYTVIKATFTGSLPAPVLRAPATNLVTNNTMPSFAWSSVRGAQTYEIEFATDSAFTTNVEGEMVNGISYTDLSAFSDASYYWHVRAYNAGNEYGLWSSARILTIDTTGPSAPGLTSPADSASTRTPTFRWTTVPTAVSYQFQYDNNSDFSSPTYSITITGNFRRPPAMGIGTYSWHVRAQDATGNWGAWSTPRTVDITGP